MEHIFFISPSAPGDLDRLCQWTFRWLCEHEDLAEDSTLYTCNSIEEATSLLESALIVGQSPALIVLNQSDTPREELQKFSKKLHDSIPETWIVEIVPKDMPIPGDEPGYYLIRRPVSEEEWDATLQNVLIAERSPQWAARNEI